MQGARAQPARMRAPWRAASLVAARSLSWCSTDLASEVRVPWWAWLWVAAVLALGVASSWEDLKDEISFWKVLLDAFLTVLTVSCIWFYFVGDLARSSARCRGLQALSIAALGWFVL